MSKLRFDYAELKVTKTDEGYLLDSPIVARTGILVYRNDDGSIRRELRRPEEVFKADSLASFAGKPITVDHPKGLVNSKNIDQLQVGTMLTSGRQDGENVRSDIVIHKPEKIGERRQLSLGYDVDLLEVPGEWNGERYDAEQTNIRINHLSIVKTARAGAKARLNMDSNEEPLTNEPEVNMPNIRLDDGVDYEVPPQVKNAIEKLRADGVATTAKLTEVSATVQTLTGERDTLKARVDGIPAELKAAADKAAADAKVGFESRAKLEAVAVKFNVDAKDKTDADIKHAVIKTVNTNFDAKDKSEAYIDAAFDMAVSSRADGNDSKQRQVVNGQNVNQEQGNKRTDSRSAREAYNDSLGSNAITDKE